MADVTIYKPTAMVVSVVDGVPPVDQSAKVATLTAQITTLTAANEALTTTNAALVAKINAGVLAAQAEKNADAASVAGQGVLDALA